MKASDLIEKARQRRVDREAIQTYWLELFPELGELNQTQTNAWLIQYDLDVILAGLDSAAIKVNKVDHAVQHGHGDEMTQLRVIKYASMCMRNTGLSEEERKAKDIRKAEISKARSEAAHKRWYKKQEVASVCEPLHDLHDFASGLHRDRCTGSGSGTGTVTSTGRDTTTEAATPLTPPPSAPAASLREEKKKTEPQTKTNTESVGVNQRTEDKGNTKTKPKACKRCGAPLSRDVSHNCTDEVYIFGSPLGARVCQAHREMYVACNWLSDEFAGDRLKEVHRSATTCPECKALKTAPKAQAAIAASVFSNSLGNVDEL